MNYFIYKPQQYFFPKTWYSIETESLFIIIAFFVFCYWIIKEMKKEKLAMKPFDLFWFLFAAIFGSLIGGRLWYYIENWKGLKTIIDIFNLSVPGLTSIGMMLGGILAVVLFIYLYNKKNKVSADWRILFAKYVDLIAPATALFVFIYRMGCFHFGDVPGTPTTLPWGIFDIKTGVVMHPTALYLSFSALLIFIFLHWYKERKKFDGEIGLLFLLIYSFNRFWIEFLRAGVAKYWGLSEVQLILMIIFLISALFIFVHYYLLKFFNINNYQQTLKFQSSTKKNLFQNYFHRNK